MARLWANTGTTGLVGSACEAYLASHGHATRKLQRAPAAGAMAFDLRRGPEPGALDGADVLVHCAYDFAARGAAEIASVNVEGSLRLLRAARESRVRKVVFLSSVSAFDGCQSLYGKGKLQVESAVREAGGAVLRSGLVWADPPRGMFGSLVRLAALPVLPVFSGGQQPFVLISIADLVRVIETVGLRDAGAEPQPITVAHPAPVPFRELLERLARKQGRKLRTVSVPAGLALAGLRTIEAFGLSVGFRSDSLVSLLNPDPHLDFDGLARLGESPRAFRDAWP